MNSLPLNNSLIKDNYNACIPGISKQAGDHQSSDSYLDNISPVALVKIIIFWPLINFSRSPTYSVSDACFKTFWGMLKLQIDECTTPKTRNLQHCKQTPHQFYFKSKHINSSYLSQMGPDSTGPFTALHIESTIIRPSGCRRSLSVSLHRYLCNIEKHTLIYTDGLTCLQLH